jgi:phage gp36-like protein
VQEAAASIGASGSFKDKE